MKELSAKQKKVIKALKESPVVKLACNKAGVSRQSHYRWMQESSHYKSSVEDAIEQGVALINDMAETQLHVGIQSGEFKFIKYWMDHNHPRFKKTRQPTFHDFIFNLPESQRKALEIGLSDEQQEKLFNTLKAWTDWKERKNGGES